MAVDLNNTRQIMLAAIMYGGDNREHLPAPGWWDPFTGPPNDPRFNCWAAAASIDGKGFPSGGSGIAKIAQIKHRLQLEYFTGGLLYPYLKNPDVLRCPMDWDTDPGFYQRKQYLSSYIWNGGVVRYALPHPALVPAVKFSDLRPTRILQWESDETLLDWAGQWNDFSSPPDEGLSRRHSDGAVIGRVDGSAGRMGFEEFYKLAGTYPTGRPPGGPLSGRGNTADGNRATPPNDLWWY